jgi:hypothetical protein
VTWTDFSATFLCSGLSAFASDGPATLLTFLRPISASAGRAQLRAMGKRRRRNRDTWSDPSPKAHLPLAPQPSTSRLPDHERTNEHHSTNGAASSGTSNNVQVPYEPVRGYDAYSAHGVAYGTEAVDPNPSWESHRLDPYDYVDPFRPANPHKRLYHDFAYADERPTQSPPPPPPPAASLLPVPDRDPGHSRSRSRSRSRSPTPPPSDPSPTYLALAGVPTMTLPTPEASRKLLVLDLNGSLLLRSKFAQPRAHPALHLPPAFPAPYPHPGSGAGADAALQVRKVHRRPYLDTFVDFLFAPATKAWLDVMVWSSAQPHSVADMVDKCFGERRHALVAVWARDTLGLSRADYRTPSPRSLCDRRTDG